MAKQVARTRDRMLLSAFDMNTVVHQNPGMWTHPDDQTYRYTDIDYWIELARLLERGGFDCLFLADVLGAYDVYGGSRDSAVRNAAQFPVGDPMMTISAMAAATERLCFGVTGSLTYELPYAFARKMTTLDHLTKGRIAWNIVTSYQKSAAINLGLDDQIPHDERYDIADEFMDVCYKLWEYSWEDNAIVRDPQKGMYTDPRKVRDIGHRGKYFSVPGAHLCQPSPQRTPFLFQAGASARGRKFAARHAEAVFLIGTNPEDMRPIVDLLRMQIAEEGRNPRSVKILLMLTPIVGRTAAEAQAKLRVIQEHGSIEAALALFGGWTGVDLAETPLDLPLQQFQGDSVRAFSDLLTRVDSNLLWTTRRLGEWLCVGGMSAVAVGTPATIVDEMEKWREIADIDGFNLARVTAFETMRDFVDLVVPELRRRGNIPEAPLPAMSIRERFGGSAKLPEEHHGATFRSSTEGRPVVGPLTFEVKPRKPGLLVMFKAKPDKADEFRQWLIDCHAIAMGEAGTVTWYGFQVSETEFGIFDTFDHENGRQAHLHGAIVKSLREISLDMLACPPDVRQIGVLATKSS